MKSAIRMKGFQTTKQIFRNISLSVIATLFFLLLCEIVLKIFGYGNLIIYEPDPKLFWKPKSNQTCLTKIGNKPIHVNSKGTRGEDFNVNKPESVFRIISLGDSKTFGWGLAESETYSGLLAYSLQQYCGDSLQIEVINTGVNAWSYSQMYVYLRDIAMKYNPDMVILADANLWTQFSENSSKEFVKEMMGKVWLKNMLRKSAIYHFFVEVKLKKFYYQFRTRFIAIDPEKDDLFNDQWKGNPYSYFKSEIAQICRFLVEHEVKPLVIYIPHEKEILYDMESKILSVKQEICASMKIPLIDFTTDFKKRSDKLFLEGDKVHPNAEGNKIIANGIYEHVVRNSGNLMESRP